MWAWASIETLLQDIRYGFRQLSRSPGFATVAVLTLALGIGANTAIFSIVYSVLLRPLPFKNPGQLVALFETEEAPGDFPLSGADYLDWEARTRTLEATSLYSWTRHVNASSTGAPETAGVVQTQANFFDVLGVQPFKGRAFARGEDRAGRNHITILSYGFWQRHFGGQPNTIGKTVELNDEAYTVIGVMPRWFNFPASTDLWTPFDMNPNVLGPRGDHNWNGLGRLKAGVTLDRARGELLAISQRLEKQYPDSNNKVHAALTPLKETLTGDSKAPLLILFGAVTLVLLLACANVANLLLARATGRLREMAVRASLGAGRLRLVRQLLTESVLLALSGSLLGTMGAWWLVRLLESTKALPLPRLNPIELDGRVLLFTVVVSMLAGILFGLAPAFQMSGSNVSDELKAGALSVLSAAGGRRRLRDALVVGEIAVTLALLVGAGLLLRSFAHLRTADIGVNPRNLLSMSIDLPETKYSTLAARRQFFDQLVHRVNQTPGIEAAAASTEIPLQGGSNGYIKVDGENSPALTGQLVGWNYITPGYFQTLGIPLLAGRTFTPSDVDRTAAVAAKLFELYKAAKGAPPNIPENLTMTAIISKDTADTFWRNQNPIGRSFHWNGVKVTILGVVGNVKEYGIRAKPMPQAYFPFPLTLAFESYGRLTVRTRIAPLGTLPAIRRQLHALDDTLAASGAQTMQELIASDTEDATVQTFLLGAFATLALILAAVGLYGVMSYLVTQRTREIGVRMALGAQRINVLQMVMKHGARLTLTGIALGVFAALALTHVMSTLLYGVDATDPFTFIAVAILLAVVASLAYYIPARRAMKIDPMLALRYE